jgi:hypothetical protein
MRLTALGLVFLLALTSSCATDEEEKTLPSHCNPLSTDHCFLPWPSSYYLKQDSATKTGYRVDYPKAAMAVNDEGTSVDPARYNLLDGFSIGSQPIAFFASGVSKQGLPGPNDLAKSVSDSSPIWILNHKTGARVPLFAEVDANAEGDEIGALIIRPQKPLDFNTRYVVVLRSALKDRAGNALQPPDPFRRLRDGESTGSAALEQARGAIDEVLAFLDKQKVPRKEVVLAWDFRTTSREAVQGNVLGMVDTALAKLPAGGPAFSDIKVINFTATEEPNLLRRIDGMFEVPSFFASDDPDSLLKLDAKGKPVYRGMQKFKFRINVPRCAETATAPLPVLIFGHGIFGSYRTETSDDYHKKLIDRLCMVEAATTWHGMAEVDIAPIVNTAVLDWSRLPRITDRLQQAHVNFQVLVELMQGDLLKDKSLEVNSQPLTDAKELYYLGISLGGIQGVAFSALQKTITRSAIHVSAGWWSMMMQRSSNFMVFDVMLDRIYPDPLDQLINIHISQQQWDYTDPIVWAGHLLSDPLPGRPVKRIMMQESRYDDQVPNMATRAVARGIGLTALTPAVEQVYGLPQAAGPLDAAYTQFDVDPPVKPYPGNTPAPKPKDDQSAHDLVRRTEAWTKQVETFFKPDGRVQNPCNGACDPD